MYIKKEFLDPVLLALGSLRVLRKKNLLHITQEEALPSCRWDVSQIESGWAEIESVGRKGEKGRGACLSRCVLFYFDILSLELITGENGRSVTGPLFC